MYDRVYEFSPIWFQNAMLSFYGRKLIKQRYGSVYWDCYNRYIEDGHNDVKFENTRQLQGLRDIISYAKKHSPYYSNCFRCVSADDIQCLDDLTKLPILDKETLRTNIESIYTIESRQAVISFTGGTTGKSLEVRFTLDDIQRRMAYLDAFKYKAGIHDIFSARKATFSGRAVARGMFQSRTNVYWRDNRAYNQRLYSTFDLQETKFKYYIDDLNLYKPEVINGFVSAVYILAKYIVDNRIIINYKPQAIFTTSETLLPVHREVIESAFCCKVYNQYASAEGAPFITECRSGRLHYNIDTGVIETNDRGEMIVTSFTNHGTPLIRYNIGDVIRWPKETSDVCECGSVHPIVESIDGRAVDFLYSPEKGRVSLSHLSDVIKGIPNSVKEVQFVQDTVNELTCYLNVDRSIFGVDDRDKILTSLNFRFGQTMKINIVLTDHIGRTSGGKHKLIVNRVSFPDNAK